MDYTKAASQDVPAIVAVIKALRRLTAESGTITKTTQSTILRNLPPAILIEVATELDKPTAMTAVLSGETKVAVK
jgi:hypothetical protein